MAGGVLGLGAAILVVVASGWSVASSLPDDVLYVYISECPYSWDIYRQIENGYASDVIPLPVHGISEERRTRICKTASAHLDGFARYLPEQFVCKSLHRHATSYAEEHFISYPAASLHGSPVGRGELTQTLANHGLKRPTPPHGRKASKSPDAMYSGPM